jgi:hypothetical protein
LIIKAEVVVPLFVVVVKKRAPVLALAAGTAATYRVGKIDIEQIAKNKVNEEV